MFFHDGFLLQLIWNIRKKVFFAMRYYHSSLRRRRRRRRLRIPLRQRRRNSKMSGGLFGMLAATALAPLAAKLISKI